MKGETVRRLKAAFRGVYPEAFGFSVYFKALKIPQSELPEGDQLVDHVLAVGYRILLKVLTPLDEGLLMRFKMKFPKTFADLKPMDVKPSSVNISLLLKLKFPEAHKLCCS